MQKSTRKAQTWASRMEAVTKPFLAKDKEQSFRTICNVLNKQNNLLPVFPELNLEQMQTITDLQKQLKRKYQAKVAKGGGVFENAKLFCLSLHLRSMRLSSQWLNAKDYNQRLQGKWLSNQLMADEDSQGVQRLNFLINHPHQGFNPCELFQAMRAERIEITERAEATDLAVPPMSEMLKSLYWELFNPTDPFAQMDEMSSFAGTLSIGEDFLPIEKYDDLYIMEVLGAKQRLLDKEKTTGLSPQETLEMEYLNTVLKDALGTNGKNCTKRVKYARKRTFKKPENNRSYACIKMSINRTIKAFPLNSLERKILEANIRFINGKFRWGDEAV